VVLRGNLCPDGAVLKQTAASPHLCEHTGPLTCSRATSRCTTPSTAWTCRVDKDTVLVMKGCGPKGAPGFPEWGHIPMPKVLLERGVSDCVRISDARMSGTSFGTVVLHVSPESNIGGPLRRVETGRPRHAQRRRPLAAPARPRRRRSAAARACASQPRPTMHAVTVSSSWITLRRPSGVRLRFPAGVGDHTVVTCFPPSC
jgi:hypothetical protein